MSAIYEVWDMETAHQVGAFGSEDEAVAVLRDVLRVNGPAVAREMTVLLYSSPGAEPITALEGAAFVARAIGATAGASGGMVSGAAGIMGTYDATSVREYRDGKRVAG